MPKIKERPDPYQCGRDAAARGDTLDEVPDFYNDAQADEWDRGWYSVMDRSADMDSYYDDGGDRRGQL